MKNEYSRVAVTLHPCAPIVARLTPDRARVVAEQLNGVAYRFTRHYDQTWLVADGNQEQHPAYLMAQDARGWYIACHAPHTPIHTQTHARFITTARAQFCAAPLTPDTEIST